MLLSPKRRHGVDHRSDRRGHWDMALPGATSREARRIGRGVRNVSFGRRGAGRAARRAICRKKLDRLAPPAPRRHMTGAELILGRRMEGDAKAREQDRCGSGAEARQGRARLQACGDAHPASPAHPVIRPHIGRRDGRCHSASTPQTQGTSGLSARAGYRHEPVIGPSGLSARTAYRRGRVVGPRAHSGYPPVVIGRRRRGCVTFRQKQRSVHAARAASRPCPVSGGSPGAASEECPCVAGA